MSELFLTREQIDILRAHRENRVERLKAAVLKEVSVTVAKIVRQELNKTDTARAATTPKRRSSSAKG